VEPRNASFPQSHDTSQHEAAGLRGITFLAGHYRLSRSWRCGADRADRRSGDMGRRQRAAYEDVLLRGAQGLHRVSQAQGTVRGRGVDAAPSADDDERGEKTEAVASSSGTALPLAQARGGRAKRLTAAILMAQEARDGGSWKVVP